MTRIFQHELTKLFLFILISFLGAAVFAPHLYGWGKDLAIEHGPFTTDPEFWDSPRVWLAEKCDSAKFSRYFNRCLMATALILLYPLIKSLRRKNSTEVKAPFKQRITPNKRDLKDLGMGLVLSMGLLTALVFALYQLGWVQIKESPDLGKAFEKAITPAIIVALLEEWLFRGVLYGVLLRKLSSAKAIIALSLFFAAVHFLKPPAGAAVADPRAVMAGFEMLGLIGQKFLTLSSFFGVFLTLFAVGVILAYSRHMTGKLWMAIGLHAGWVFSLKFTNRLTDATDKSNPLLYNDSLMDGLLPLFTLVITGALVALYLKPKKL